ncbi:MAG: hypothetical protein IKA79_03065, partial [Lentisphaeria bacterium]|nr:hypothetical protein [Lentisphaeria bacterium]
YILGILEITYPEPLTLLDDLNPKGALQEYTQARYSGKAPRYSVVAVEGPPHDPVYTVEVVLEDIFSAAGKGSSRKNAEQSAAAEALKKLRQAEIFVKENVIDSRDKE